MKTRMLAVLILGLGALLVLPGTAHADEDDWAITRYEVTADAAEDGAVSMVVDFDFDFADEEGHGPQFVIPVRQRIDGDPEHYRAFDVDDIKATSGTGAPTQVETSTDGGALVIRIGDEDVDVTGVQNYRLSYTIRGVVNPAAGAEDQDEIYWNIIGADWEVPLSDITITLSGPAEVGRTDCFAGDPGDQTQCTDTKVSAEGAAYFAQDVVEPGEGLTVVADWPADTFVGAEPRLIPRRHFGNLFPLTPVTGSVGGLLALLGIGAAARMHRRGRDEVYLGLTPGVTPSAGERDSAPVGPRKEKQTVAVRFTPPDGVRPGQMGTVIDERADHVDVVATIVDLAVRGHLRIEEYTEAERADVVTDPKPDWKLIKLSDPVDARPYEQELVQGLFDEEDEIILSEVSEFGLTSSATRNALYEEVVERGWFQQNPQVSRTRGYLAGFGVALLGIAATIVLAITLGWGWVGAGIVVAGIAIIAVAHRVSVRTAEGSAILAQSLGFQKYIETAEANQIRFEEGEDLFSRYLPHAIVFGEADRWSKIFAELAEQGHDVPAPNWYVGAAGVSVWHSSLTDFGTGFSDTAVASMSGATAGSGGASGFGGGMVGGGVGGGGGGGW